MVTRRTVLFYNFGVAALFAIIGLISMMAFEPLVSKPVYNAPFDAASHQAIHAETDIERLRNRAAFYFEIGRDLKQARYADTGTFFADFRKICFLIGIAFMIGGALALLALRSRDPQTGAP